jgi:hypothetical protein
MMFLTSSPLPEGRGRVRGIAPAKPALEEN